MDPEDYIFHDDSSNPSEENDVLDLISSDDSQTDDIEALLGLDESHEDDYANLVELDESRGDDVAELNDSDELLENDLSDEMLSLDDVVPSQVRSEPQAKHGWTDELCLDQGQKYCTWEKIPASEMEGHLINFVNLWFSPDNMQDKDIWSTIRNVLLMMPLGLSEELLLKDVLDSATGTAQTQSPISDKKIIIKDPQINHLDLAEKIDVLAFHEWLKRNFLQLQEMEKKSLNGQPHCPEYQLISQKLRTVLGFCALILLRLTTKGERQIKRYFPYGASKAFDLCFSEAGLYVSFVAPAPKFFKLFPETLKKNSVNSKIPNIERPSSIIVERPPSMKVKLLYLVVFQYLKSMAKNDESSQLAKQILEEGCLNALEGNGMGLVTLFHDVKLIYPYIEDRQLLSTIADPVSDATSQDHLIKFLDTYSHNQPDKPQYSWKWARILSQDYFSNLSIRNNVTLCSKFTALVVDKNPSILQHKGFGDPDNQCIKDAMTWAISAKEDLKKLNDDIAQSQE